MGIIFALLFASLLAARVGLFQRAEKPMMDFDSVSQIPTDREIWMNIFQKEQKIGHVHRQFLKTTSGYRLVESVYIQINTLGMVQDVRYRTVAHLDSQFSLSNFDFELQSSLFHFKARGGIEGKRLTIYSGLSGSEQKTELPIEHKIYLPFGILEAFSQVRLRPGDYRNFLIFDPMSMAQRSVKVTFLDEEEILIMGRMERAKKISVDFMGAPQFAWIGKEGAVLREEGSLGIRLEQTVREEALKRGTITSSADFAESVSIASNKLLSDIDRIQELTLRLQGVEEKNLFLDGDRQLYRDGILVIRKESLSDYLKERSEKGTTELEPFLKATPFIQSDHPEILAKAKTIISKEDPDLVKVKKLVSWIHQNIKKRPVISVPNALETLRLKVGDCNEHAVLLAAFARALGIPAQVEAGLVYQNGRFYYHAWNVLHIGGWITADSVMGQFPADVTHLRFVRGTEQQVDLMGVIGKVKLKILSETK